jgi:hypothetical protein
MSTPTYITKSLLAASSTSIGSFSSAGVVTLSCVTLDTARRISVASASALGQTFTIFGLNQTGNAISESIATSSAVAGTPGVTTQDFIKVTNVTISSALSSGGGGIIGTNTQGGTPWNPINTIPSPTAVSFNLAVTSASTVVAASFETTFDYPSYDPRSNTWGGGSPTTGPRPTISSLGSTVTSSGTTGILTNAFAAWRVTITSSSSSAGSVLATVLQSGY